MNDTKCSRCDGCGKIAGEGEHEAPWSVWKYHPAMKIPLNGFLAGYRPCPICDGEGMTRKQLIGVIVDDEDIEEIYASFIDGQEFVSEHVDELTKAWRGESPLPECYAKVPWLIRVNLIIGGFTYESGAHLREECAAGVFLSSAERIQHRTDKS